MTETSPFPGVDYPYGQGLGIDTIAGGQIQLWAYFASYEGSSVPADLAATPTITIAATTTSTGGSGTPVAATTTGVAFVSQGVYNYTWAVAASTAPGDYQVTWSGTDTSSNALSYTYVVTVTAQPAESPGPGIYATVQDYRGWSQDTITPDSVISALLPRASEILDMAMVNAVYSTDLDSMPNDPLVIDVFRRACCAQVKYMVATNDPDSVKTQFSSVRLGGGSGGMSLIRDKAFSGSAMPRLAPQAAAILHVAGAAPGAPLISW